MIIIKTSTDSHKAMKVIANALLNNKLAACVNMIPRMRSKYIMDGRITESREVILLIKTTEKLEDKVYKIIPMIYILFSFFVIRKKCFKICSHIFVNNNVDNNHCCYFIKF